MTNTIKDLPFVYGKRKGDADMDFQVIFERTYNAIHSDIDVWLMDHRGKNAKECEMMKTNFTKDLIGKLANKKEVAEIAVKHFEFKPAITNYFYPTNFIQTKLDIGDNIQNLYISLDFKKIHLAVL